MIQFGIYGLSAAILLLLLTIIKNSSSPRKSIIAYIIICFIWLAYIWAIQRSGFLESLSFPPRVPLLIIVPAAVGIMLLIRTKTMEHISIHTKWHIPILLQSFRVAVELLIYGSYLIGVIPLRATFEGINYDILVGISAVPIGLLAYTHKISINGLLIWNILSLMVLSVTVFSFISSFYFTDFVSQGDYEFVKFPYVLIAAVLLPTAIFLHIFSLKQLRMHQLK